LFLLWFPFFNARAPLRIPECKLFPVQALAYSHRREDGIRELGARFPKTGDSLPRMFIARRCVNLISELLEYQEEVKEKDHAC